MVEELTRLLNGVTGQDIVASIMDKIIDPAHYHGVYMLINNCNGYLNYVFGREDELSPRTYDLLKRLREYVVQLLDDLRAAVRDDDQESLSKDYEKMRLESTANGTSSPLTSMGSSDSSAGGSAPSAESVRLAGATDCVAGERSNDVASTLFTVDQSKPCNTPPGVNDPTPGANNGM